MWCNVCGYLGAMDGLEVSPCVSVLSSAGPQCQHTHRVTTYFTVESRAIVLRFFRFRKDFCLFILYFSDSK